MIDTKNDRDRFFNLVFDGTDPETERQMARRGVEDSEVARELEVKDGKKPHVLAWIQGQRNWAVWSGTQCYLCSEPVADRSEADILAGYWWPTWFLIHKGCRPLYKEHIIWMQEIDGSCNDCGWFKRESGDVGHCVNVNGRWHGRVRAYGIMAHGSLTSDCFQHRRHGMQEGPIKDTPIQPSLGIAVQHHPAKAYGEGLLYDLPA